MPSSRTKLKQYGVRVNGMLIRKSFALATEARAWQRKQKELQDQLRAGSKKHLAPTLLLVHAADWLRSRKAMASFGHEETRMGKYVLTRPKFQGKLLHEISKLDWKEVFGPDGDLVKTHGLAPATHNLVRAMVHKMYEDARREYEPPRAIENPVHDIPPLDIPKKKLQILSTKEEVASYISAAYRDEIHRCYGIYTAIKLNTGLRQQNIMPLRWRDHDTIRAQLHIREKFVRTITFTGFLPGSKSDADERAVGVNTALTSALAAWRAATPHQEPSDFIVARKDGKYLSQKQIWDCNLRACEKAKIPYLSEHKLRHSYATHYLASGGNIHDLKLNLFHSSVTTTEIYSHGLESEIARRAGVFQADSPTPTPPKDGKE